MKEVNGFGFYDNTSDEIIKTLLDCYSSNRKIRVWYGHNGETDDISYLDKEVGLVGKLDVIPNNLVKTPKMLGLFLKKGSKSYKPINFCSIVRIYDTKTKKTIYMQKDLRMGVFSLKVDDNAYYKYGVYKNGEYQGSFDNRTVAEHYIDFMNGTSYKTYY